MRAQGTMN